MTDTDLHAKLVALDANLSKAEDQWQSKMKANSAHLATNQELRDRYTALKAQVAHDEAGAAKMGHSISDLEHSVRMWIDRLGNNTS